MGRISKYPKGAGIYKLTCNTNNKIYIGKSVSLRDRLSKYKQYEKVEEPKQVIMHAIKKYGWSNFQVEILENFDSIENSELLKIESDYIRKYNSNDPSIGYNICLYSTDRTGIPLSDEHKEKLRLANLGKTHSVETKQLLSNMFSGENHPMYGKHYDKDKLVSKSGENSCWYGKVGELHPTHGRKHTIEAKEIIKEKRKTQDMSHLRKEVIQIDLETGEELKTWPCSGEVEQQLGILSRSIRRVCSNDPKYVYNKSAGGFGWRYALNTTVS